MDRATCRGITSSTPGFYGGSARRRTEQIIGRWFARGGGRREKTVLATKVYGQMGDWPNESRLSALHIIRGCEASLRRLQTDRIDLYQMHHVDRDAPWDEIWQAMETLVAQGKVLYVGSSNFAGWHIAQANEAPSRPFLGLVSEQSLYPHRLTVESVISRQSTLGVHPLEPTKAGARGRWPRRKRGARQRHEQKVIATHRPSSRRGAARATQRSPGRRRLGLAAAQTAVTAPIIVPGLGQLVGGRGGNLTRPRES